MSLVGAVLRTPKYTLVRGMARFTAARRIAAGIKGWIDHPRAKRAEAELLGAMQRTLFSAVDREQFLTEMQQRGCSFGLRLPNRIVDGIVRWADRNPVYAFRMESCGFMPTERNEAEAILGKEILLAQYFNTEAQCPEVREVAADPLLRWVPLRYLGSVPYFLGCNLWWTYPVTPNRSDQLQHAHFFHRDVDDFRFIKFFFYLTDVDPDDGAHWLVAGSHRKPPHIALRDHFLIRRFEDEEIAGFYERADILEVTGPKGAGFAEDTLCVHKGATPKKRPRLVLQLQFAMFDLGVGSENRVPAALSMLAKRRTAMTHA